VSDVISRGGGCRRGERHRGVGRPCVEKTKTTSRQRVPLGSLVDLIPNGISLGRFAGLTLVGCGQVSVFFSASFPFFYFLFSVLLFLIQVLICFFLQILN
jgi:hypothetical protein